MRYVNGGAKRQGPLTLIKWAVAWLVGSAFLASAVCRAHDGHDHGGDGSGEIVTTPEVPVTTTKTEGRLYYDIEMMGISGSASGSLGEGGETVDLELPAELEDCVPQVPLPAALWAGLAGGVGVMARFRSRSRRCGQRTNG